MLRRILDTFLLVAALAVRPDAQRLVGVSSDSTQTCFSEYEDGTITQLACTGTWVGPSGLDFHPQTGQLYLANASGLWEVTLHPGGGWSTSLAAAPSPYFNLGSIAVDSTGRVWALANSTSQGQYLVLYTSFAGLQGGPAISDRNDEFLALEYDPSADALVAFKDNADVYILESSSGNTHYIGTLAHGDSGQPLTGLTGVAFVGDMLYGSREGAGAHGVPFTSIVRIDLATMQWWTEDTVYWPTGVSMGLSSLAHYTPPSSISFNGTGANPDNYTQHPAHLPRVGAPWRTRVQLASHESRSLVAISLDPNGCHPGGLQPAALQGGELLALPPYVRPHHNLPGSIHTLAIPLDADLVGQSFCTQGFGLSFGPLRRYPRNALQITIGSN